jgi:hypothetical protein
MSHLMYRVVQPFGQDKPRGSTTVSEHHTATEAFAGIDRLSAELVRTGASSNAVELIVVDADGRVVTRPMAH